MITIKVLYVNVEMKLFAKIRLKNLFP